MKDDESDAIMPNSVDNAEYVREVVREIDQTAPTNNYDEIWASAAKYSFWGKGLKPYLQERIEMLKSMSEVNFSGKETVEQIGIRYLICGGIAKELEDIIVKVEQTKKVLDDQRKENALKAAE
jgi:hypothetical protein